MSPREEIIALFDEALSKTGKIECGPEEYADALDEVVSTLEIAATAARVDAERNAEGRT